MSTKIHTCMLIIKALHRYCLTYLTFSKIFYIVCPETKEHIIYIGIESYKKSNPSEQINFLKRL
jgi:hypothetical protein